VSDHWPWQASGSAAIRPERHFRRYCPGRGVPQRDRLSAPGNCAVNAKLLGCLEKLKLYSQLVDAGSVVVRESVQWARLSGFAGTQDP
jgi:hypothetical protein